MCVEGECVPCEPAMPENAIWNTEAGEVTCSTPERPVKSWHPDWECPKLTEPCEAEPPPVDPSCPQGFPQGQNDDMTGGPVLTDWADTVDVAMQELTGCAIGDWTCSTGMEPDEWMHAVIEKIKLTGLCAGRHIDTTPGGTDEIAVTDNCAGWWEGYKIYNYTPGQRLIWSAQGKRPAWKLNDPSVCGNPTEPPVDPPPGGVVCVDPELPWHERDKYKLKCPGGNPNAKWCDSVPSCHGHDFCVEIGMPTMPDGVTPRWDCPPRPEGAPDRQDCESVFNGGKDGPPGDPIWTSDGEIVMRERPDGSINRAMAYTPDGTWIRVCNADGVCGQVP